MKKRFSLLLAVLLIAGLLFGCTGSEEKEDNPTPASTTPAVAAKDADGDVMNGRIGELVETYFYTFKIDDAYLCHDYHGYKPQDGMELLVVHIEIENAVNFSIPMADYDFQATWSDTSDDALAWPITSDPETFEEVPVVSEAQLPYEYELAIGEKRSGDLVYEVPQGEKDFYISAIDDFADEEVEGNFYCVCFTPEHR